MKIIVMLGLIVNLTGCVLDIKFQPKFKAGDCLSVGTKLLMVTRLGQYDYEVLDLNGKFYSIPMKSAIEKRDCFGWFKKNKEINK